MGSSGTESGVRHFLSIGDLPVEEAIELFRWARLFKQARPHLPQGLGYTLAHTTWVLLFSKPSTRTRLSFEIAIRELGGESLFLPFTDLQLARGESMADTARVMGRLAHGAIIRTYAQAEIEEFSRWASIPTVNALSDEEHPCQVLSDIFSFEEKRGSIQGKRVAFLGDGSCNVARSWAIAASRFGFDLIIGSPHCFWFPSPSERVFWTESPWEAAQEADLLYTDVWVSMGKEGEKEAREELLRPYQLRSELVKKAKPDVLVFHCLPAYKGKEITAELFEARAQEILDQAENRLHVQKALLSWLVKKLPSSPGV
ncbi:ornithine carbamoyltransferase [Candidatus Methylacidithermus pantelleriae]|nr:ornithine carbamoyltransferase [Candidatus Methylacidithermus pantelleriae]